jgi:hypothetical protein
MSSGLLLKDFRYSYTKYKFMFHLTLFSCYTEFAASEPVAGLQEGTLLHYFADLRQLLDLFMTWDWPTYFHDYGQENSKYQQVNPNTAIVLLEK